MFRFFFHYDDKLFTRAFYHGEGLMMTWKPPSVCSALLFGIIFLYKASFQDKNAFNRTLAPFTATMHPMESS